MKVIYDTLTNRGTWSQKRIMVFVSFKTAAVYAFMPAFMPSFEVKEFVFLGFLGAGGFGLWRIQKRNENTPPYEQTTANAQHYTDPSA